MTLTVIFSDDCLLVIDKPPGLVSTPSETRKDQTLSDILQTEYGIDLERGGLVHRLDKDTSGIVLVAKNQESFENLQKQFAQREVKKEYTALAHGFTAEREEVDGAISRNPGNREKFVVLEGGKEAVTYFDRMEKLEMSQDVQDDIFEGFNKIQKRKLQRTNYGEFSLLKCFPKTGRTHQIRVHLKHIEHPIVGDEKYAGRKTSRLDKRWCKRQFLHASKIEFSHPISGKRIVFESPIPEDLKKALKCLTRIENA